MAPTPILLPIFLYSSSYIPPPILLLLYSYSTPTPTTCCWIPTLIGSSLYAAGSCRSGMRLGVSDAAVVGPGRLGRRTSGYAASRTCP